MAPGRLVDCLDVQHREIMDQAVIAKVIAERPFGQLFVQIDGADDAEVGLGRDRQKGTFTPVKRRIDQAYAAATESAGEGQLRHSFRKRHDGRQDQGRRPADDDVDPER